MRNPEISIIAAISENRAIGKDNKLLWRIPKDLVHFKELTLGHAIIMGRKTYKSIGKTLEGRVTIVVTRDDSFEAPDCIVRHSLEEAIEAAKERELDRIFIVGGGQIYAEAIGLVNKLYLTVVEGEFEGDTFFPGYSDFKKVVSEQNDESGGYKFKFLVLERNSFNAKT